MTTCRECFRSSNSRRRDAERLPRSRIEGPGATAAVQSQFRARSGRPLAAFPPDRLAVGRFGGDRGEEVVVRRRADDAVELHCHGGLAAVAMIEGALMAAGCQRVAWRDWAAARHADPIAAAALTALADARTQRTAAILLDQYHGALSRAMDEIRQAIDCGRDDAARRQIDALLGRADLGRHLVQPWRVVLAGRVNVGKSSLINALAGYGRSIVHPSPGTTRDAVTVTTAIDGWPVELCDTAGLRSVGEEMGRLRPVERAGIELARARLAQADLAILVFDQQRGVVGGRPGPLGPVVRRTAGPQQVRSSAGAGRPAGRAVYQCVAGRRRRRSVGRSRAAAGARSAATRCGRSVYGRADRGDWQFRQVGSPAGNSGFGFSDVHVRRQALCQPPRRRLPIPPETPLMPRLLTRRARLFDPFFAKFAEKA